MLSSLDPVTAQKPSLWRALTFDLELRHVITLAVLFGLSWLLTRFINLGFKRVVERHRQRGTLIPETATQLALGRRLLTTVIWITAAAIGLS